jgi:hypothetical protein
LSDANDFASLKQSVQRIGERLSRIESAMFSNTPQPAVRNSQLQHPSQEKFEVADDFAPEQTVGARFETEKPCPFEPAAKPCDGCSMCSSLGF